MLLILGFALVFASIILWTIIPTLREHSALQMRDAFIKCAVIWAISTFPVFVSLFFIDRDSISWDFIFSNLSGSPFSWSEQLIYSSTFLAPVIYAVVDGIKVLSSDEPSLRRPRFQRVFKRYWRVWLPSIALLLVTMSVFTAIKVNPENFRSTLFFSVIGERSILIYLVSWIYWYCVVLIDSSDPEDPASRSGRRTRKFTDAAGERIGEGG